MGKPADLPLRKGETKVTSRSCDIAARRRGHTYKISPRIIYIFRYPSIYALFALPFLLALSVSTSIFAAGFGNNTEPFTLGEISVTAPEPDAGAELISVVDVITDEKINETGARNIAETMEYSAGVDSRIGGRGEARLNIRGLKQRQILIMEDGVPYTEAYNNILDLNRLPVMNVSKVEVVKGASSVLYGPYTLGPVVNIVGGRPGEGKKETSFRSEYGEQGRWSAALRYGAAEKRFYYVMNLVTDNSEGFDLSSDYRPARNEDGGRRENSDFNLRGAELRVGGTTFGGNQWAVTAGRRENRYGMPPIDSDFAPRRFRYDNNDQSNLNLRYSTTAGKGELSFSGLLSHYYESYKDYAADATYSSPLYYYSTDDDTRSAHISYVLFSGARELEFRSILKSDGVQLISGRYGAGSGPPLYEDYSVRTFSVAVESRSAMEKKIRSTIGVSFNGMKKSMGGGKTDIDATASLSKNVSQRLGVVFSTGLKSRYPTPRELYEPVSGNAELSPERAFILSLDMKMKSGSSKYSLSLFRNRISSLIAKQDFPDGSKVNMNVEKALLSGFEISFAAPLSAGADFDMNFTRLNAMDKTAETDRDRIQYMPVWKLNYAFTFRSGKLGAALQASHVGRQYYYFTSGVRQQLPGFETFGIRAEYDLLKKSKIYGGVRNITDENYEERIGAPSEGRTFYAGFESYI